MKIYMRHVREVFMCSRGARQFFDRHELNWTDFLRNGIDAEIIEATGDAMALKVVEVAKNGRK
jgi:hypothetical protein